MCLWIYCCGMAAHIWWITRMSSLRFSWRGCVRTLRFNWSNNLSTGFKSRLFAGHLSVCTLRCLLQAYLVCFKSCDMMRNPVPASYRDGHGYEEESTEWRHFDTSSQLSFLEWLNLEFSCAWKRLSAFCYTYFRHIQCFSKKTINKEYFPTKIDNYLAVHGEHEHITYFRT